MDKHSYLLIFVYIFIEMTLHLSANSYDNVHCYIGGGVGQDLQGAAVYSAEISNLLAQGYTI
jgi:hypothetical protein